MPHQFQARPTVHKTESNKRVKDTALSKSILDTAQIYTTLANAAIDVDDPSTVGFDVDFGMGSGLINAPSSGANTRS
jgi:uncharacterized protein with PhoU and TrkA domain